MRCLGMARLPTSPRHPAPCHPRRLARPPPLLLQVPACLLYSTLVTHYTVDPHVVCLFKGEHSLAPQMEVTLALMVVMA